MAKLAQYKRKHLELGHRILEVYVQSVFPVEVQSCFHMVVTNPAGTLYNYFEAVSLSY